MSLITCPECSNRISDQAETCPKCGFKLTEEVIEKAKAFDSKFKKGCGIGCLSVVVFIVIAVIFLPDGNKSPLPDELDAFVMSQEFVRKRLKSPSTADFCWFDEATVSKVDSLEFIVNGHVDAQNSFGATVRIFYTCQLRQADSISWRLVDLQIGQLE